MANQNSVHPVKVILISDFHCSIRKSITTVVVWAVAALATLTWCQMASAQNSKYSALEMAEKYRVELAPYDADEDQLKAIKSSNRNSERNQRESLAKVKAILTGNGNFSDPIIKDYFEGFEFPAMTTVDDRVLSKLGETRTKFIKDFFSSNVSGPVRAGMIDLTLQSTQKISADDSLHPAARLNAVYLMGMLDQVPPVRSPAQLPVPSSAAFDSLIQILNSPDTKAFPAYLKVAALAGIQRHVEIDRLVGGQISVVNKQALLQKALNFLDDPKSDDLSYWLKRRGMQMLGLIGDPQSIDRVIAVLNSEDAAFWLKFDALEAIGNLKLTDGDPAKSKEATVAITNFLASSLEQESKSIQAAVDKLVFDQLLFQDLDLKATGTNYEANELAKTGSAFSGGGMDGGDTGRGGGGPPGGASGGGKFGSGGGGAGAGMGMGAGAGGPGAGGFGAGAGSSGGTPSGPTLELPGYQLIVFRRRIKSLAFTGSQILGGETGTDGLARLADADGKALISKVVANLNSTLEKSNVGIIDLDARKSDDEPLIDEEPVSVTQQLIDLCAQSGKTLGGLVSMKQGEPEAGAADADVGAAATPAADQDKPGF